MLPGSVALSKVKRLFQPRLLAVTVLFAGLLLVAVLPSEAQAPPSGEVIPLSQIQPGMQGYAYTIFSGDQVEKFDLEVLGVMPNFLGPKQSIILVQLKGAKVERTGVVAGMSGSPVYFNGKLAGALSLKLGVFTKDPIAGVTPIEDVLRPERTDASAANPQAQIPQQTASNSGLPSGAALQSIETPLVFSGFQPAAIQKFSQQLAGYGFVAAQGGTTAPRPDDGKLAPGDMAGMVLVQGDASINSACTVTAVQADRVFLCGHPFLSLGDVQLPMARSRVVTTLSSDLNSTKIVNVGGSIGTITGDHLTAVTGKLGAAPSMLPLDLALKTPLGSRNLHFEVVKHPKLTPLLVALTAFNGLTQNALYGEGTTLKLSGEIRLKNHAPVQLENIFGPGDSMNPDGMPVALTVMNVFTRIFTNSYEAPDIERVSLQVESIPGRQSYTIESAWLEKGEASPGEALRVRALVRPYRGPAHIEETTVRIPEQAAHGTILRVLVSDAETMNRASRGFSSAGASGGPEGLDQLIAMLNLERRNDRFYVGLFAPSPTMIWDDKQLPNVPLSQINIVDGRPAPGTVQILRESLASEASVPMGGPVAGVISLNLPIR